MKNFHKALIILAILLVGQLMFLGFAKVPLFIVRSTAGNNTAIIPLKSGCQKVSNNCSYPLFIPLYPSGGTKSFFLNPPSCVTLSECMQLAQCQGTLPPSAIWNTSDYYEQTWNGYGWSAPKTANYNPTPSANDCRFKCSVNYSWNASSCLPDTKVSSCTAKPTGTVWNTVSSITQTWNGSDWFPSTVPTYNPISSTAECRFTCAAGYRRDAGTSSCINTCAVPASLGGGIVTHNTNITAFQNSSVTCGSTCVSQVRTCNGETGLLSGSYTNATCSIQNCIPTANNVSNAGNEASSISLTANATDSDGSIISYQWYSNSTCTTTIAGATSATYTAPVQNEPTTRTYYYKAFDNQSASSNCASATATWNNVAPTANNVSASANEGSSILLTSNVSDPGGTTFSYQWYANSTCTTAIAGATSYDFIAPAQNEPQLITYSYKTFDLQGSGSNCATATATWNNVAPTANNVNASANEGSPIGLTSNVSDPAAGTTFTYQWHANSTCTSPIAGATAAAYTAPAQNEPGPITYYYKAFDAQGAPSNCASAIATWNNLPPTNLSITNNGPVNVGSNIIFTANAIDTGSTIQYQFYQGAGCPGVVATWSSTSTFLWTLRTTPGTHSISFKARDNWGMESACSSVSIGTWTNAAPTMSTLTNNGSKAENTAITFTAAASDVGGGTLQYEFYVGSCGGTIVRTYSSTATYSRTEIEPITTTIYARAKDAEGAVSSCLSSNGNWTNVAPTANNVSASANEGSAITLTSNHSDPGDGTTFTYQWHSNSTCTTPIAGATSPTYTAPAQGEPGQIIYYYQVSDAQTAKSNCASATATWNNVAPSVPTITKPTSGVWTNSRQFCATVSDIGGGNVTAYFVIGGSTYAGSTVASNGSSCYTHTADLNGTTVYAYARDSHGGTSANTANITARIDATVPSTPALSCTNFTHNVFSNYAGSTTCSINNSGGPSPITVAYSTNGGLTRTNNGSTLSLGFTPLDGTINIVMRISDTGGGPVNSNTFIIKKDTTAPTGTISINGGAASTVNAATTLTLSASDTNGISQMQFSCNNTNRTTAETYATSKAFNITNQANAGCTTAAGTKTVYVKYKDTVGNRSTVVSDSINYIVSVCGNGIKEGTELCDGFDLQIPCTTTLGKAGTKYCNSTCDGYTICVANSTPPSSYCGDGTCNGSETASSCPDDCSSSTCFVAGTQVTMQDGSQKNIEDVKLGEQVLGQDNKLNTVIAFDRPNLGTRKLYSINNGPYFVTHEHPFMTLGGWKSISPEATWKEMPDFEILPLKVGDILVKENGKFELIWSITSKNADPKTPLYNFKLDGNNTYYADGYLVHNKLINGDNCTLNSQCACGFCDGGTCCPTGGCFVEGTKILLPDGILVPIEEITTGDIVLGMNNSQNTVVILYKLPSKSWKLYAINNSDYFVTDTHPFMTTEGWKSFNPQGTLKENPDMIVSELKIGDILVTKDGIIPIYNIDFTRSSGYVYNFKLNGNNTYYADGYLVHNPLEPKEIQ